MVSHPCAFAWYSLNKPFLPAVKATWGGAGFASADVKKQVKKIVPAKPSEDGVRPDYDGDEGEIEYNFERNTPIEKKPVPYFCYGKRVRIAALHEQHE